MRRAAELGTDNPRDYDAFKQSDEGWGRNEAADGFNKTHLVKTVMGRHEHIAL